MPDEPKPPRSLNDVVGRLAADQHRGGVRWRRLRILARWAAIGMIVLMLGVLGFILLNGGGFNSEELAVRLILIAVCLAIRWYLRD